MKRLILIAATAACVDTTGGERVTYDVAARGVGLTNGALDTGDGWHVELSRANFYVGAVYLNLAVVNSGSVTQGTDCVLPGIYTGEELAPLVVDVLSSTPQPFPMRGAGTNDAAKTGEVWLTSGDVNAKDDPTVILDLCGVATKAGSTAVPFTASVTIGTNRLIPSNDPANPSAHPICKQRIVSPIQLPEGFQPVQDGTLTVSIDPTLWFASVDFSTLAPVAASSPESCPSAQFEFPDDNKSQASQNLFAGVHSFGAFSFAFQ